MAENGKVVIVVEDVLFRAIRYYKPTSLSSSGQSHNCKILKVQPHDRPQENTRLTYTPKIISIGPLHHGKPELQPMEDLKHKYLNEILNRRGEDLSFELSSDGKNDELLRRFLEAARKMEEEVRGYYELSNTIISSDDFVHMLVIDGCFLLELLFGGKRKDLGWQLPLINHDILLFENQIPFFVLQKFYEILGGSTDNMVELAYDYLNLTDLWAKNTTFLGSCHDKSIDGTDSVRKQSSALKVIALYNVRKTSNLLHLYHMMLFSENHRPPFINRTRIIRKWTMALFSWLFVIVSTPMYFIYKIFFADNMYQTNLTTAMEIEEAGVRFHGTPMALRFDEGTLSIPVMILNHENLRLFKNLMIFEFYYRSLVNPYAHTYVSFLSDLIKNPGDLKVMEKHHIIITSGGGDESFRLVSDLLQAGLENHVPRIAYENMLGWQSWFNIQCGLKTYCGKPRHRWRAKLMKDYLGNPWSTLGVLAGVILLVLTTLQTVFTLLSYYHQ